MKTNQIAVTEIEWETLTAVEIAEITLRGLRELDYEGMFIQLEKEDRFTPQCLAALRNAVKCVQEI